MNEHDQSRKFADKSAAVANETLQKGKAAVDQSVQAIEQTYSAMVEKMRDYNLKMIDMAQANTVGVFEFARQLATAKSSFDLVELWTAHSKKQIAVLNEQIKELTVLGQKMAGKSAEPITRSFSQVFKNVSRIAGRL
jgi:phasin